MHRIVLQADLWLIDQCEFVSLERFSEISLQLVIVHDLFVHLLCEELEIVTTSFLRLIHRHVRVVQKGHRVSGVIRIDSDTHTGRDGDMSRSDLERFPKRAQNILRSRLKRERAVGVLEHKRELVTAEAG